MGLGFNIHACRLLFFAFSISGVYALITRLEVPEYIHHEDTALMICDYDAELAQLSWLLSKPGNNKYSKAEELLTHVMSTTTWSGPALGRMTGAIIGMSSTLTIHSVDWQMDNGKFWCETIAASDYSSHVLGNNTIVSVSPSVLRIYDNSGDFQNTSSVSVVLGTNHMFTCRAEGCNPSATLTWVIGDIIENPAQTDSENIVAGLWDTTSSYNLIPDVTQHNEQLKCIASVPAETFSQILLVVIYIQDLVPNTTTSTSHYPVTSSTQSTTFEYMTSDIVAYVEVIRVESRLIEIVWESFDIDVIDDVDEYWVFYSASLSESQNDNNAIFLDGGTTGVNITSLTPNTMYNIRVEASTTEGTLINVGNIEVTTAIMETDGFPFAIVASITAAVIAVVIVGVVVVCCMRSRRSAKVPLADASTNDPVYDVAKDNEVYEDLQPITQHQKHVYQCRIEPTDVSSDERGIEYEVPPSGTEYEIPKPGPEYLELYNTAPTTENPGLMKHSGYMFLDKHTMDKDNVNTKYESLEVQSEYLQLYDTVPVDNHDIEVPNFDLEENQPQNNLNTNQSSATYDITCNVVSTI